MDNEIHRSSLRILPRDRIGKSIRHCLVSRFAFNPKQTKLLNYLFQTSVVRKVSNLVDSSCTNEQNMKQLVTSLCSYYNHRLSPQKEQAETYNNYQYGSSNEIEFTKNL